LQVVAPHIMNPTPSGEAQAGIQSGAPEDARPFTAGGSKTGGAPKSTLRANLVILKILVREVGVQSSKNGGEAGCGLSVQQIMKLTKASLAEADSKTRKSGIAVIVELEKIIGLKKVMKYLVDVKPATLRKLELKMNPDAAADRKKSKSALPPLSDLKATKPSTSQFDPLGSTTKSGLKVLGQKVKPAHVNPMSAAKRKAPAVENVQDSQQPIARTIDFASDVMNPDDESFMHSIAGC